MAKKLLIIDDQAGTTKVVGMIASQMGFDVRAINTPMRATEVFVEYRPDIIVLDMIMPEKDGIDVLNEILLTGIPTKIVLTSGLSSGFLRLAERLARFHGSVPTAVLRKPFKRAELIAALTEASTAVAQAQAA